MLSQSMESDNEYPPFIFLGDQLIAETIENISSSDHKLSTNQKYKTNSSSSLSKSAASRLYETELCKIREFDMPKFEDLHDKLIFLGTKVKKYTLVLDLDNTMVFCKLERASENSTLKSSLSIEIRPYAIQMLKDLEPFFEIVVFTAADEEYANIVVGVKKELY